MSTLWKISSVPPHDFFLCLDVDEYFDYEHQPEKIFEEGFSRPIPVGDHDVMVTVHFNGDPDHPEFSVSCAESLSANERDAATAVLNRILGCRLDYRPLYEKAVNDPVLGPKLQEFYGLKRVARANFFEDAMNRMIQTQISHKPTARKMVHNVREAYGVRLNFGNRSIPAWPRPKALIGADPVNMKQYGLSERKGEYLVGLAHEILSGNLALSEIEGLPPMECYDRITKIRGIGPTTAQDLTHFRERTDGFFPSRIEKGEEQGLRRWIILSYGGDPNHVSEEDFLVMIRAWHGYEAGAIEFLFINWVLEEKRRKKKKA